jgi:hypothetical protein
VLGFEEIFLNARTDQCMTTGYKMDHFSIHILEKTWTHYGIDVPCVIGFLCGVTLVWLSSDRIKEIIDRQATAVLNKMPKEGMEEERQRAIHEIFDWPGAKLIGVLERILYVYAVQILAWPLVAGWLAMKAFFIRLAEPDQLPVGRRQPIYHLYLYGNMISVLSGLIFGHIARAISAVIWKVF